MANIPCVCCKQIKTDIVLVFVRDYPGSKKFHKARFLCADCRKNPFTKGWWKYADKPAVKGHKKKECCNQCGHLKTKHSCLGCSHPIPFGLGHKICGCTAIYSKDPINVI